MRKAKILTRCLLVVAASLALAAGMTLAYEDYSGSGGENCEHRKVLALENESGPV